MKMIAVLMIVVGVLIAGLSGLCTAAFGLTGFVGGLKSGNRDNMSLLVVALVVGGPFIAAGVGLVLGGIGIWKRKPRDIQGDEPWRRPPRN